jgi:hypothetical protein
VTGRPLDVPYIRIYTRDMSETIYTEVTGCTTYIGGERGVLVEFTKGIAGYITGGFVRLDERPAMIYVTFGKRVTGPCECWSQSDPSRGHNPLCRALSDRLTHREVTGSREVTRDEFDALTGLAEVRRSMGWDLVA